MACRGVLGIDPQDRIWVTNGGGDEVVRFPASDPTKVEKFKHGQAGARAADRAGAAVLDKA